MTRLSLTLTPVIIIGVSILLAILNLATPATSALHVSDFVVGLAGKYLCYAMLALAVGLEAGVSLAEGAAALEQLVPGDRRGAVVAWRGAQIINDCYNSNPAALAAMIDALVQVPALRHIVVAGEMLELGPESGDMHAEMGEKAAQAGVSWVIGVQGAALALAEAAARLGTPALFLETAAEAGAWMKRELREGDAVLLKGSRGVRLEAALAVLMEGEPT